MATPTSTYTPTLNEFTGVLVEKIGRQLWSSRSWRNPLSIFKKGSISHANEIEEIYVSRIAGVAQDFDGTTTLDRSKPDVKSQYHKQEYSKLYTTSVSDKQARRAFYQEGGVRKLADEQLNQLQVGYEYDEYVEYRANINRFVDGLPATAKVNCSEVIDEATAKEITKKIKTVIGDMMFRSTTYSTYETSAGPKNLVIVTIPKVGAEIDVELLSQAFNMEKAEINLEKIYIDSFATFTDPNIQAIVMDKDGMQCYMTLYNMETQRNAQGMFTNYHLNVEEIVSTSNLYPGAYFTTTV